MMVVMMPKCIINDETVTPITYLFWPDFFSRTTLKSFSRDLFLAVLCNETAIEVESLYGT